jgi:hypothetical protein
MLLAVGMANAAAVYGGGVACTASYIKIVYYMALGIGPSLLLKTRDKRGGHGSEITDKTIVKPPTAHE